MTTPRSRYIPASSITDYELSRRAMHTAGHFRPIGTNKLLFTSLHGPSIGAHYETASGYSVLVNSSISDCIIRLGP